MDDSNKPKAILTFTDDFHLDGIYFICQTDREVAGVRRALAPFLLDQLCLYSKPKGDRRVQNKKAHL
jgi:hypothetical protein